MNLSEIIAKHYLRFPGPRTIECGEGWSSLVEQFLMELDGLDQKYRITLFCIKEKFGTMDVCPNSFTVPENIYDDFCNLAEKYRKISKTICESCGNPGKLLTEYYLMVRCNSCSK